MVVWKIFLLYCKKIIFTFFMYSKTEAVYLRNMMTYMNNLHNDKDYL